MATKGERTREMIVQQAAQVFNQRGYWGTSIADLVEATGLERGGIYNHFANKDEIALAAFDYARHYITNSILERMEACSHAADKLKALADAFIHILDNPDLPGGCAILNTAIDADDTHPNLRNLAQESLTKLQEEIQNIVTCGISNGHLRPQVNGAEIATLLISTLEGGVMMSKLYGTPYYLRTAIHFLHDYIDSMVRC